MSLSLDSKQAEFARRVFAALLALLIVQSAAFCRTHTAIASNDGLDEGRCLFQLPCKCSQKGLASARAAQELGQQSRTSGARATQEL